MKESYREAVASHAGPEPCEGNKNLPPRAHPRRSLQHGPRTRSPIRLSTQTRLTVENPPQAIEVGAGFLVNFYHDVLPGYVGGKGMTHDKALKQATKVLYENPTYLRA